MFRDAFKRHRCIIPANGYYEMDRSVRRQRYSPVRRMAAS
jgi:putative SOS response-associated peptidase YedK